MEGLCRAHVCSVSSGDPREVSASGWWAWGLEERVSDFLEAFVSINIHRDCGHIYALTAIHMHVAEHPVPVCIHILEEYVFWSLCVRSTRGARAPGTCA